MPPESLNYATGSHRAPLWGTAFRGFLRYAALGLVVAALGIVAYVSHRWPWVWHGSKQAYEYNRMLTLTLPPDQVVYEPDPARAAKLLVQPSHPRFVNLDHPAWKGDYVNYSGSGDAAFAPPFYREPIFSAGLYGWLVFMHERRAPSGKARVVWVQWKSHYHGGSAGSEILISATSHTIDKPPMKWQRHRVWGHSERVTLTTAPHERLRLYAGQPDPADPARFTIRYEINDVPGTIVGRLEADDTVTLRILDGPAATRPTGQPSAGR